MNSRYNIILYVKDHTFSVFGNDIICCLVLVGKKSKDDGMIHPLTFDVDTMGLVG